MALSRQQAVNAGTRIESKDIVKVDLKKKPFTVTAHDGQTVEAHAGTAFELQFR
jgi:thioredoxin reductase (NADPH)